jgi:hypothetical protein
MRSLRFFDLAWMTALCMSVSCVEPYSVNVGGTDPNYLVVDGFLNASENKVSVRLTRAVALSNEAGFAPVNDDPANPIVVNLEDESGNVYPLSRLEGQVGEYEASAIPLNADVRYRVHVTIPPSEEYASEYVEIKQTPAIEKVFFDPADKLRILIDTSDPTSQSKYYRWTYSETWEYTSPYNSTLKLVGGEVVSRPEEEQIYRCYKTDNSQKILLASSTDLSSDIIRNFELIEIEPSSEKLRFRYSVIVRQIALTEDAYTFWLNLYKTTENVGGLFDPMPGEVRGNFRSMRDPSKTVIGYFTAGTVSEQRIFITPKDLPENYLSFRPKFCQVDSVMIEDIASLEAGRFIVGTITETQGPPATIGYLVADRSCADCVYIHGGVNTKPSFWP